MPANELGEKIREVTALPTHRVLSSRIRCTRVVISDFRMELSLLCIV